MITDLIQISRLGEKKRGENEKFRRWIKSHNFVERQFRGAAKEVHAAINCRECAECCRVSDVPLAERDVDARLDDASLDALTLTEGLTDEMWELASLPLALLPLAKLRTARAAR